jgi:hypothetical protein
VGEVTATAQNWVWERQHVFRSKSSSAVVARFDLSPIIGFAAFHPRQAHIIFWELANEIGNSDSSASISLGISGFVFK